MNQAYDQGSNSCYGETKLIPNRQTNKRANMSMVMHEGVKISCKAVTAQFFTVVGLIVKLGTDIEKPKGYIYASPSIR